MTIIIQGSLNTPFSFSNCFFLQTCDFWYIFDSLEERFFSNQKKQLSKRHKFHSLSLFFSTPYRFFVVYSAKSIEEDGRDDEEEY